MTFPLLDLAHNRILHDLSAAHVSPGQLFRIPILTGSDGHSFRLHQEHHDCTNSTPKSYTHHSQVRCASRLLPANSLLTPPRVPQFQVTRPTPPQATATSTGDESDSDLTSEDSDPEQPTPPITRPTSACGYYYDDTDDEDDDEVPLRRAIKKPNLHVVVVEDASGDWRGYVPGTPGISKENSNFDWDSAKTPTIRAPAPAPAHIVDGYDDYEPTEGGGDADDWPDEMDSVRSPSHSLSRSRNLPTDLTSYRTTSRSSTPGLTHGSGTPSSNTHTHTTQQHYLPSDSIQWNPSPQTNPSGLPSKTKCTEPG